VKEKKCGPSNG